VLIVRGRRRHTLSVTWDSYGVTTVTSTTLGTTAANNKKPTCLSVLCVVFSLPRNWEQCKQHWLETRPEFGRALANRTGDAFVAPRKNRGQGCLLAVGYSTIFPPRGKTFLVLVRNGEGVINYEGEERKANE
jgi:hypothetical protein